MKLKTILGSIAPALATALGGPLAGTAVKVLSDKFLGRSDGTEADILEVVQAASPEMLAKIKEIDAQFAVEMRRLDVDLERIAFQDRDSARQLFKINIWPQVSLSAIFVGGYLLALGEFMQGDVALQPEMLPVFTTVLGVLTAGVTGILQFWFGSSMGSKQKTDALTGSKSG